MRVLLEYKFDHASAIERYEHVADRLRARGHTADPVLELDQADLDRYDLLVSHADLDAQVLSRPGLVAYGGRAVSRTRSLELLAELGCPTMLWSRARTHDDVRALFDRWLTDALFLKRSRSFGGKGTCLFDRKHLDALEWDPDADVFCANVNPECGDVYKAELFGSELVIAWCSGSPPLPGADFDGFATAPRGAYGERSLHRLPWRWRRRLRRLGGALVDRGFAYCSLDFMRTPSGALRALEVNTELVATWWTAQFDFVKERTARAIERLVREVERGRRPPPYPGVEEEGSTQPRLAK